MEPDTYFFSPTEALRVAQQHNRSSDENQYDLQVCYYNGEQIDSELINLVHLPIENIIEDLAHGTYRIPTHIDFTGLELSSDVKEDVENNLLIAFSKARELRTELNKVYATNIKNTKLDFSQPLRFYLRANIATRVMQHVSKNIADALKQKGYDVFYELLQGVEDMHNLKYMNEFNPHVTININHIYNHFLSDDVFNFVWFQDAMPVMVDNSKIVLRDRDYIFTYNSLMKKLLVDKGVDEKRIFDQTVIPADTNQFYIDENIKREDKVVFVGTYYENKYPHYINNDTDKKIKELLERGESLSLKNLELIFTKFLTSLPDSDRFINYMQQSYIRNVCLSWLCEYNSKKIEVFGYNWDSCGDQNIVDHFKGKADKTELNSIYNSAKYALAASGRVINTQRLGEVVHSGAIPIVYDSRDITDEDETWDDECLYFKTKEQLHHILDNNIEPKKYRSQEMLKHFTYDDFIDVILSNINKTVNEV